MDTLKLLWFFLWRVTLWGLALGAACGAVYATVGIPLLTLVFAALAGELDGSLPLDIDPFSLVVVPLYFLFAGIIGAVAGAPIGLVVGVVCGSLLFVLTRTFFYPPPNDGGARRDYARTAGIACVVTSLSIFVVDWLLFGYPDPYAVAPLRMAGALAGGGTGSDADGVSDNPTDFVGLAVFVFSPIFMVVLSLWFSGRMVAGQYMHTFQNSERR